MRSALVLAAGLAFAVQACASPEPRAKAQVDAVVVDEVARQAAAKVADTEADSQAAMKAAEQASTREPATPPAPR